MSDSCDPIDQPTRLLWIFQARLLEWVAIRFSRGFSQPKDQTQVSCTASRFFTNELPGKPRGCGLCFARGAPSTPSHGLPEYVRPRQEREREESILSLGIHSGVAALWVSCLGYVTCILDRA